MRHAVLICALIVLPLEAQQAPQTPPAAAAPQPEGPRVIVSYFEVAPSADAQALPLLRAYRDASRKDAGNTKVEVLQRIGVPGHFVITEEWNDDASWKAHRSAAHVTQFREKLQPLRVSPYEERSHTGLTREPAGAGADAAVTVVTHVDVVPANVPKAREMMQTQAMTSRKEAGNLRFDVLQGVRMNHFTIVESWRDERAYQAHIVATLQKRCAMCCSSSRRTPPYTTSGYFEPFASALLIAARSRGSSGVTSLGKNATTCPSRPITYFAKFQAGRLPERPRNA
jgi:quinol monooxygenase YgiN